MILYKDEIMIIELPEKGFVKGHIIIKSAKNINKVEEIENNEFRAFMWVANQLSSLLFEKLQGKGSNIVLKENPFEIHVVNREFEDNIKTNWDYKKLTKEEFDNIKDKINSEIYAIDYQEKNNNKEIKRKKQENIKEEKAEGFIIKQLIRIP